MEQVGSGVIGQCRNTQIPKHEGSSEFDASPDEGYAGLQREEGAPPLSPPCIPPKFVLHGFSPEANPSAFIDVNWASMGAWTENQAESSVADASRSR